MLLLQSNAEIARYNHFTQKLKMSSSFFVLLCLVAFVSAAPQQAVVPAIQLDPICLLPPVADPTQNCNNFSVKYFFDAVDGDCEDFLYSGCGATENVFDTELACELRCENVHDHLNSFESVEIFERFRG